MRYFRHLNAVGLLVAACGLVAVPARANMIIVPTFDSSITSDSAAAGIISTINQAIGMFEANIVTGITVNITFKESGGLGNSSTFFGTITYNQYLAALQSHSSHDATDNSALATLPAVPKQSSEWLHFR